MKDFGKALSITMTLFFKDKVIMLFSFIPIIIGMVLYFFSGSWLYGELKMGITRWLEDKFLTGDVGVVLKGIISFFLLLLFLFVVNWTFSLIVAILASPFNDAISSRVERHMLGEIKANLSDTFLNVCKNFFLMIFTEIKKVTVILFFTFLSLTLSFIPILFPLSICLSGLLLASNFLDYSWSRHGLKTRECLSSIKMNWFSYLLPGILLSFLMAIPIINLILIPLAVIFFSVLWVEKNKNKLVKLK